MRRFFFACGLIVACVCIALQTVAQTSIGLVAYYSFDDCDAFDDSGNGANGVIGGSPQCVCGPSGNALQFDGGLDEVRFLGNFNILFTGDFTISFYFLPGNAIGIIDLLSKKENCTIDNSVAIRYESGSRTIRAEISKSINFRSESRATLPMQSCWHHITWVRNGNTLLLYVNGTLVQTVNTPGFLDVVNNGVMSIANSPCLANGEQRFSGRLDELRMYNRALSTAEVQGLFTPVDRIATRDVFVFLGESVQVEVPSTCANSYTWSPAAGVSNPSIAEPLITPSQSVTYQLRMDYATCIARDTLRITVIDSSLVECADVFMPNAFTPNGDQLNDVFGMSNKFFLGEFIALEIYDRWGTMLFRGTVLEDKWDGTYRGESSIPDLYLYKLYYRCEGTDYVKAGAVSLIR